jgi:colicin import membrane protein
MSAPNPPRQVAGSAGRLQAVLLSILFHAAVVGLLGWGFWRYRAPKPAPQQLAIEATVVIDKSLTPAPAPAASVAPAQPAPEPATQPTPTPAPPDTQAQQREQQQREQQLREQRAHEEQQRAADERAEHERVLREQREQAEAEQHRREQEAAAQKVAAQKAADAAQAAKDKARRESELRAQLAQEERVNAARGSAAAAEWLSLIRDRVTRRWIRPASASRGLNCEVNVTQVPGGEVTHVEIGSCNGDAAVRESIEAAVMRASPLPSPSNPDLFDRNLKFNFRPDE